MVGRSSGATQGRVSGKALSCVLAGFSTQNLVAWCWLCSKISKTEIPIFWLPIGEGFFMSLLCGVTPFSVVDFLAYRAGKYFFAFFWVYCFDVPLLICVRDVVVSPVLDACSFHLRSLVKRYACCKGRMDDPGCRRCRHQPMELEEDLTTPGKNAAGCPRPNTKVILIRFRSESLKSSWGSVTNGFCATSLVLWLMV